MENKYYDYVFGILAFFIPISMAFPNILIIPLIIILFFFKKIELKNNHLLITFAFSLFFIVKAIIYSSFIENLNYYKNLFLLILISFITLQTYDKKRFKKGFILGVLTSILVTTYKSIEYYYNFETLPFGNHKDINNVILIHRPYLGFMCFIALVFLNNFKKNYNKNIIFLLQGIILIFTLTIVARLAMLLCLIYLIYELYNSIKSKKSIFYILIITSSIPLLILVNPNIKKRFKIENEKNKTFEKFIDYEPRFVIWNCLFEKEKSANFSKITGFKNILDIKQKLHSCYGKIEKKSKRDYFLKTNFNSHNQFLDIFYQGGIIGCILLTILLGYSASKINSFNSLILFVGLLLFLSLENLLERQFGVYLLGILLTIHQDEKDTSYS